MSQTLQNEGELYKRIQEIEKKAYLPTAGQAKTVVIPFLKVLDEAKQDYPFALDKECLGMGGEDSDMATVNKWFIKWFGKSGE